MYPKRILPEIGLDCANDVNGSGMLYPNLEFGFPVFFHDVGYYIWTTKNTTMGVDISGKNPKIISPKPGEPDWETCSDEERSHYFQLLGEWQEQNPGDYFRANWWSWRPIVALIGVANSTHKLGIDLKPFNYNEGAGLDTQEECDALANALEKIISVNDELQEEDSNLYLCLGSWSTLNGGFVPEEKTEQLNEEFPVGTVLHSPIVLPGGSMVKPSHGVSKDHLMEFIAFLRNCGGFEIW